MEAVSLILQFAHDMLEHWHGRRIVPGEFGRTEKRNLNAPLDAYLCNFGIVGRQDGPSEPACVFGGFDRVSEQRFTQ